MRALESMAPLYASYKKMSRNIPAEYFSFGAVKELVMLAVEMPKH